MQDEPYEAPLTCACGCGGPIPRHRWPSRQVRFRHGHNRRGDRKAIRYVEQDCGYTTPCWVWQLAKTQAGYGQICVGSTTDGSRRHEYAHRYYYEQTHGPIPDGLEIDHLCRNPACCNPDHLEAVEPRVNVQRSSNAKLTQPQVDAIRAVMDEGGDALALSKQYGVTRTHVYYIAKRKTWAEPGIRSKAA